METLNIKCGFNANRTPNSIHVGDVPPDNVNTTTGGWWGLYPPYPDYTNYCSYRLPCGICSRTNAVCPVGVTTTVTTTTYCTKEEK